VREAGLEVAVSIFNNFLVSNYVINSSEPGILCATQSIDFMLCDSVKGQNWGQIHNQYTPFSPISFFSLSSQASALSGRCKNALNDLAG